MEELRISRGHVLQLKLLKVLCELKWKAITLMRLPTGKPDKRACSTGSKSAS